MPLQPGDIAARLGPRRRSAKRPAATAACAPPPPRGCGPCWSPSRGAGDAGRQREPRHGLRCSPRRRVNRARDAGGVETQFNELARGTEPSRLDQRRVHASWVASATSVHERPQLRGRQRSVCAVPVERQGARARPLPPAAASP